MTDLTPSFRALCWELVNELHGYKVAHPMHCRALLNRARAALATPPPEPPTEEGILAMRSWSSHSHTFDSNLVDFARRCYNLAKQPVSTPYKLPEPEPPTDEELNALWNCCGDHDEEGDHYGNIFQFARAVLKRWGAK